MEYRQLGRSGLKVPVFSLGTGTFGGVGEMFARGAIPTWRQPSHGSIWHQHDFNERNPKPMTC